MQLTNKHDRHLGVPGAEASIIIEAGKSVEITDADLEAIEANGTASIWLKKGLLEVSEKPKPAADDRDPEKAYAKHVGGGKYKVFLNDEVLTEESLTKEEAEKAATEFNEEKQS